MTTEETIKAIKKELRANMNGVASTYMRESGLSYHVNWGIELPRLHNIASEFEPNLLLAQKLWQEDVRESKILATLLCPVEELDEQLADLWVEQIANTEIAQIASLNLFSKTKFAPSIAFRWIADEGEMKQLCGYLIVARLLQQGAEFNEWSVNELNDQMESVPTDASLALKKAIQNIQFQLEDKN